MAESKTMSRRHLSSLPEGGCAVVIGASGAIGTALRARLENDEGVGRTIGFSRAGAPLFDITSDAAIAGAAAAVAALDVPVRLVIDATGFLHGDDAYPEKAMAELDSGHMAKAFEVNAIGPALLMKHFLPLLADDGKTVFCTLSARVGSIADNRLGGWYSYRASKAALNQLVRTASVELKRLRPAAICAAYHPGTVDSALSAPFQKTGLDVQSPDAAAGACLSVLDRLTPTDSGGFFDYTGKAVPW
jgi:NAD(P)-dependent dehydrogenase (short-subunit alcohol dehydrogenase family)